MKYHRIILLLFSFCFFVFMKSDGQAFTPSGTKDNTNLQLLNAANPYYTAEKTSFNDIFLIEDIKDNRPVITVGYHNNTMLMSDYGSYNAKGYGYDLLKKLEHSAKVKFKFVEIEGSLTEAVQNGIVDISGIYGRTKERIKQAHFGQVAVSNYQYSLSVKEDGKTYYYDDPSAINGKTVATYASNPGNKIFETYLKENGISVNLIFGELENFIDLEADYYITPSPIASFKDLSSVLNLSLESGYFFTRIGNEKLIEYLDQEIYKLFVENGSLHYDLVRKYQPFGNQYRNRELTKIEAAFLRGQIFKVGYISDHAPYQDTNTMGEPTGINIEFLNYLANRYEFSVEYFPYHIDEKWDSIEEYDILISLLGDRNYLSTYFDNTDSYYSMDMTLVLQENLIHKFDDHAWDYDLPKNAKIGMLEYLTFKYNDFFLRNPSATFTYYNNASEMFDAFKNKEVDAIIVTEFGGNTVAASIKEGRHQFSLGLNLDMEFLISKKLSDNYREVFNVIINKVPFEKMGDIIANEMANYYPEFGLEYLINEYLYLIIAILIGFVVTVSGLIIIIRQRSAIDLLGRDDITLFSSMSKFTKDVNLSLTKAKQNEYEMILLDIDYFRMINNYYGTTKGTEVIKAMSNALVDAYKGVEVLMTRRYADQFILFKKISEGRKIQDVINAFVIPQIKTIVGERYSIKMSVGYSYNEQKADKANILLDNANTAHHIAKKIHNTSFQKYTDEMRAKNDIKLDIIYRMEHAITNNEFQIFFQPKISVESLKIVGAEAMVHWITPVGDIIYPKDFIPIMAQNGFITQLDMYAFEKICIMLQRSFNDKIPKIALNISPSSLSNPNIIKQMVGILKKYKIHPSNFEIEISESAIGNLEDSLPTIIKILHKIGFSVIMDNFGAGSFSLTRLSTIEVNAIKFDHTFYEAYGETQRGLLILNKVIQLSKELKMKIIAGEIEDASQAQKLEKIKCDLAQGSYFSEAIGEEEFKTLLQENRKFSLG